MGINKTGANKPYFCFLMEMPRESEGCRTNRTLLAYQIEPPLAPSPSPLSAAYKVTVL